MGGQLALTGYSHSVETFGTVDGPGIRYVLFLAGCRMRCRFCHNPDTRTQSGKSVSIHDVLEDYEKYREFYQASGGGLTVSGGEPLLQPDFVAGLFKACRERNINTLLDTSGFAPKSSLEKVLPYSDAVRFGLKIINRKKHRWLTGQDNSSIMENLNYAAGKVPLTVSYVVIPGVNDCEQDINDLAATVSALPARVAVELLAYHKMGLSKWDKLGIAYQLKSVRVATGQDIARVRDILEQHGIEVLAQKT